MKDPTRARKVVFSFYSHFVVFSFYGGLFNGGNNYMSYRILRVKMKFGIYYKFEI